MQTKKKSLLSFFVTFLIIVSAGCDKESDNSQCVMLAQDVTFAAQLYESDPTATNCGIYKTAIQNYLNSSCANDLSATDRQAFENKLSSLNC